MNLPLNQSSSIQLNSREFCDNNLSQFSSVRNCSTSWATSIVRIAEHALNNTIHLSVQQLLQCLPSVYGINACQGVNTTSIVQYLAEFGLVEEDQFTSCSTISEMKSFRFAPTFIHSFYELISIVSKKPVFVTLAVSLSQLRLNSYLSTPTIVMPSGSKPSLFGILSGYYSFSDYSYWKIHSHVIPCEEIVFNLAMSDNQSTCDTLLSSAFTLDAYFDEAPSSLLYMNESHLISRSLQETFHPNTFCSETSMDVLFGVISGDAYCSLYVFDTLMNIEESVIIERIIFAYPYCLQSGYYLLNCSDSITISINYLTFYQNFQLTLDSGYKEVLFLSSSFFPFFAVPEEYYKTDFDRNQPLSGEHSYPIDYTNDHHDFTCNKDGYLDYLNQWPIWYKGTSRDPSTSEFQKRLRYFI